MHEQVERAASAHDGSELLAVRVVDDVARYRGDGGRVGEGVDRLAEAGAVARVDHHG